MSLRKFFNMPKLHRIRSKQLPNTALFDIESAPKWFPFHWKWEASCLDLETAYTILQCKKNPVVDADPVSGYGFSAVQQ